MGGVIGGVWQTIFRSVYKKAPIQVTKRIANKIFRYYVYVDDGQINNLLKVVGGSGFERIPLSWK